MTDAPAAVVALAGDTMLGRGVASRLLGSVDPEDLVAPELAELTRSADLFVLNLECCISERGEPWPEPGKQFFFRAPPRAVETLIHLGVHAVSLANNHALDYGFVALGDTLAILRDAGIAVVGAGADAGAARTPAILEANGVRIGLVGFADHPASFAAGEHRPGVAFADLRDGLPDWLSVMVADTAARCDVVLISPHWGPNMTTEPLPVVRAAAAALVDGGATVIAGHSAHVFHGARPPVLYDLGDFLDDYARDRVLRNDLGLLWLVEVARDGVRSVEAVPLRLELAHTGLADGADRDWIARRLTTACAEFGTEVTDDGRRLGIGVH